MNLELTNQEKDMLVMVLENFIPDLRAEIASGVKHEWKIKMHKEEDILKEVLEKLKGLK
ncbi:hypothetical protein BMS3Bbin08_02346 [bacterium BMS3Bbin08]|nr:hypothetical protein BMS3Bbin08_02346 [bacterium BMS3Bbin08]